MKPRRRDPARLARGAGHVCAEQPPTRVRNRGPAPPLRQRRSRSGEASPAASPLRLTRRSQAHTSPNHPFFVDRHDSVPAHRPAPVAHIAQAGSESSGRHVLASDVAGAWDSPALVPSVGRPAAIQIHLAGHVVIDFRKLEALEPLRWRGGSLSASAVVLGQVTQFREARNRRRRRRRTGRDYVAAGANRLAVALQGVAVAELGIAAKDGEAITARQVEVLVVPELLDELCFEVHHHIEIKAAGVGVDVGERMVS